MTTQTSSRRARTTGIATLSGLAALALAIAAPLSAGAHVRVDPGQAGPGGYTTLTFKVPNESATASTTSLTVDLPTDTPFTSVSYQPVPGWTAQVTTAALPEPIEVGDATVTEAPVSVTWTAIDGAGIGDGEFQLFPISVGPVPDTGSIVLPAHQGYSDGTVVDWDEPLGADGAEPEHPAPVLYVNDAPPVDEHAGMAPVTAGSGSGGSASVAAGGSSSGDELGALGLGFGIGGFVLGAGALVVAALALLRRRPTGAAGASGGAGDGTVGR
ncbi:YcnI family protein [Herbiconiux sp. CPCC 205716]|uniref:YcnI family protein n=1 Tax=Herbiconiux gentiana TaxID=2970912 RepID=A0ABT2GHV9_9MICO|nr:YcnI family protein [Herbiconiux gentiana]MCS5715814.1 YcnI family protein [Herbiconiux gentiana]